MSDIILNKIAVIERCLSRINIEFNEAGQNFENDYTRQDSVVLNIERAIQACIDVGAHIISDKKLGLPQNSREVFKILGENGIISDDLRARLERMVGFRNIAVHDYQKINIDIIVSIVKTNLRDFDDYTTAIMQYDKNEK